MSQSLDRRLTFRERLQVRLHLWVCVWCIRYLAQMKLVRKSLAYADSFCSDKQAGLTENARERILTAMDKQSNSEKT